MMIIMNKCRSNSHEYEACGPFKPAPPPALLVDAALVGFDRRESVTIPPLPMPHSGLTSMLHATRCCPASHSRTRLSAIDPPPDQPSA
jgi:hypothetical protein